MSLDAVLRINNLAQNPPHSLQTQHNPNQTRALSVSQSALVSICVQLVESSVVVVVSAVSLKTMSMVNHSRKIFRQNSHQWKSDVIIGVVNLNLQMKVSTVVSVHLLWIEHWQLFFVSTRYCTNKVSLRCFHEKYPNSLNKTKQTGNCSKN